MAQACERLQIRRQHCHLEVRPHSTASGCRAESREGQCVQGNMPSSGGETRPLGRMDDVSHHGDAVLHRVSRTMEGRKALEGAPFWAECLPHANHVCMHSCIHAFHRDADACTAYGDRHPCVAIGRGRMLSIRKTRCCQCYRMSSCARWIVGRRVGRLHAQE